MEIRPILSAMLRNKTGAILIALQIALTLAIVCNAVFIIHDRLAQMGRPSGMDEENIFLVSMAAYKPDYDADSAVKTDVDVLRNLPGVVDATYTESIPLSGGGWSSSFTAVPDEHPKTTVDAGEYHVDEHGLNTLGVKLVEGRNFTHDEINYVDSDKYTPPPLAIVTRAFAEKMWPGQDALGKNVYEGMKGPTVVGVVDTMEGTWPHWEGFNRNIIMPSVLERAYMRFMVRTLPGQRDEVMKLAEQKLKDAHTGNFVRNIHPLTYYRDETNSNDHAMTVMLSVVTVLILAITALGIMGLASFSVRQRTRQIGTRRALGARRIDIVRYFMTENWLITTMGVLLGSVFAVALNYKLVNMYDLPHIPWYYIPVGIVTLWVLGLLAVLGPALKAAAIPPAIATRNV
ncbi:MAG TPA: FtsX-like permease family protein [Gammaproteobacteria bacterium]|jgi:putative ABC transport system permease protein